MKTYVVLLTMVVCLVSTNKLPGQQNSFIDKSRFDTTIHPGDNFYLYVNGGYFKNMMQSRSSIQNQPSLDERNQIMLSALLKKIAANDYPEGSGEQKLSDFLKSTVDTVAIEKLSLAPIIPVMKKIDSAKNPGQLMQVVGELYADGAVKLFGFEVRPDKHNSKVNIAVFTQAGTTLPFINKTRYTSSDSAGIHYRKIHADLIKSFFRKLGDNEEQVNLRAGQILDIERMLSSTHLDRNADPSITYNKMSVKDIDAGLLHIGFSDLLLAMGIVADTIVIANLGYYQMLNQLLARETLDALKAKIKFDYLYRAAQYLSNDFLKPYQKFITAYRGAQFGTRDFSYNAMTLFRDLVAQLYVKDYVKPEAKQKLEEMAKNIRNVYLQKIRQAKWMTPNTKMVAIRKLENMVMNLGYPDKWDNYDDVHISPDQLFANYLNISRHNHKKLIERISQPVDRSQWRSTPISTEASFSWEENAISVHAGNLQLPVFDADADDAINYSGMGVTIGHEMSHAFDDLGRKYDEEGNLQNWWQPKDDSLFNIFKQRMIAQYAMLVVYDSLHINARSTFNENLADLNGLIIAYEAFKNTKEGTSMSLIDGLTPDQRFFINYSVIRGTYEPKTSGFAERFKAASINATHSPPEIRVNGPLSNFEPFYHAFKLTGQNKMYLKPNDRLSFW